MDKCKPNPFDIVWGPFYNFEKPDVHVDAFQNPKPKKHCRDDARAGLSTIPQHSKTRCSVMFKQILLNVFVWALMDPKRPRWDVVPPGLRSVVESSSSSSSSRKRWDVISRPKLANGLRWAGIFTQKSGVLSVTLCLGCLMITTYPKPKPFPRQCPSCTCQVVSLRCGSLQAVPELGRFLKMFDFPMRKLIHVRFTNAELDLFWMCQNRA